MVDEKSSKVKLVFPCGLAHEGVFPSPFLPYGMAVMSSFLRQNGCPVEQQDLSPRFGEDNQFFVDPKRAGGVLTASKEEIGEFFGSGEMSGRLSSAVDKVCDAISTEGFRLVGFSVFAYTHFISAAMLSRRIKERTGVPIVFGGPYVTLWAHLYPEIFDYVDYAILGDGRVPLLRLIDCLDGKLPVSEVPGLIHRKESRWIVNPQQRYPVEDNPMPDFDGLPLRSYGKLGSLLPYQMSRGCVAACSFCVVRGIEKKLEFKPQDKVMDELGRMRQRYKRDHFFFCDSAINNSRDYLEAFCDRIIKDKLDISWDACAVANNLERSILGRMREAGCRRLLFGIESGSDRILGMMNKGFSAEQAGTILRDSAEVGISNSAFFVAGYPHETPEDVERTVGFIKEHEKHIHVADIGPFSLLHGSRLAARPEAHGIADVFQTQGDDEVSQGREFMGFAEVGGLSWEEKRRQIGKSYTRIIKAFSHTLIR